ncbi:hypothetical protein ACOMHN_021615 [Nucella lapillus]
MLKSQQRHPSPLPTLCQGAMCPNSRHVLQRSCARFLMGSPGRSVIMRHVTNARKPVGCLRFTQRNVIPALPRLRSPPGLV